MSSEMSVLQSLGLGPITGFDGPTSYYEYDYVSNAFTQVNAPGDVQIVDCETCGNPIRIPDADEVEAQAQQDTQKAQHLARESARGKRCSASIS